MPVNFLNLERKDYDFRKGIYSDPFDEPTYLTFSLDFMFDYKLVDGSQDMIRQSPLFKTGDKDGLYSATGYLTNRGYSREAENLIKFQNLLKFLTNDAPWYFQSISGLNKMWEQSMQMEAGWKAQNIELTVDTLEAVDLRISNLASLYRNSVYDTKFMRERVPDNMRWFSMDVWVAEFRNLRNVLPALVQVGNFSSVNLGSLGGLLGSSNGSTNDPTASANVLSNFGFMKFKCHQCEFDFTPTFVGGETMNVGAEGIKGPNTGQFKIKVGWFEQEESFANGDTLTDDWTKKGGFGSIIDSVGNLPIVGDKLSSLSSSAAQQAQQWLNTPNNLVNGWAKDLQKIVEGGGFGEVSQYGYASNGDEIPGSTAVPKNLNGNSL